MSFAETPMRVNAKEIIDPYREMHYRFHQSVDPTQFPQVHDFYELTLVTEGAMELEINHVCQVISCGALVLLHPGDIHSRRAEGRCAYINLAFSQKIMVELFRYLDDPATCSGIWEMERPGMVQLSQNETDTLRERMERLSLLPIDQPQAVCTQLKWLVLDIVMQYIVPLAGPGKSSQYPVWLRRILHHLNDPEHFSDTLADLAEQTGLSREHICRGFKEHLGQTPTQYLNEKRLNYAANLLLFSDKQVIDIAYLAGFQSLSWFYHAFRRQFGVSPSDYRKSADRA